MEVRVAVNGDEDDDVIGFDDKNSRGRPKFKVDDTDNFETNDRKQVHSSTTELIKEDGLKAEYMQDDTMANEII